LAYGILARQPARWSPAECAHVSKALAAAALVADEAADAMLAPRILVYGEEGGGDTPPLVHRATHPGDMAARLHDMATLCEQCAARGWTLGLVYYL
jgi:hypothetical protein